MYESLSVSLRKAFLLFVSNIMAKKNKRLDKIGFKCLESRKSMIMIHFLLESIVAHSPEDNSFISILTSIRQINFQR